MMHGDFSGEPETAWLTQDGVPDRGMRLLSAFSFTDPAGDRWVVPKDYVVDGASIPRSLWSLVGSPFTGDYRRASIVHDKACKDAGDRNARRAADRMFYHACRAGHCSPREATLLFIGVRIGAWTSVVGAWKLADDAYDGPRLSRTPADARMEADYQLIAEYVLDQGEVDDPAEIERRTDAAALAITGLALNG